MKYRGNNFDFKKEYKGTVFSETSPVFRLDEVTGKLEQVGVQNDVELAQSDSDCALVKVLERYGYIPEDYINSGAQRFDLRESFSDEEIQALAEPSTFPTQAQNLNMEVDLQKNRLISQYGTYDYKTIVDIVKKELLEQAQKVSDKGGETDETKNYGQAE